MHRDHILGVLRVVLGKCPSGDSQALIWRNKPREALHTDLERPDRASSSIRNSGGGRCKPGLADLHK